MPCTAPYTPWLRALAYQAWHSGLSRRQLQRPRTLLVLNIEHDIDRLGHRRHRRHRNVMHCVMQRNVMHRVMHRAACTVQCTVQCRWTTAFVRPELYSSRLRRRYAWQHKMARWNAARANIRLRLAWPRGEVLARAARERAMLYEWQARAAPSTLGGGTKRGVLGARARVREEARARTRVKGGT